MIAYATEKLIRRQAIAGRQKQKQRRSFSYQGAQL